MYLSNRNKSVQPYSGGSNQMVPFGGNIRSHFDEFDRMADRMMANFGMPKMDISNMMPFGRGDPFKDDPFFADSGFGRMDQMMKEMRSDMKRAMDMNFSNVGQGLNRPGQGQFVQQTFVSSTKLDQNGRPIQESYQNKVAGAIGNGNKVIERQQLYGNTGTGLQKASHERMLNDKGRKVVKERVGQQMNTYDHFKNMREEEGERFDLDWGSAAQHLGLPTSTANNRLGYGGSFQGGLGHNPGHPRSHNAIQYDDERRGAYVNNYARGQDQPVNFNRQVTDIAPTQVAARALPMGGAQTNQGNAAAPLALTDGRQGGNINHRASNIGGNAGHRQAAQANVYAVPRTVVKQPARAG